MVRFIYFFQRLWRKFKSPICNLTSIAFYGLRERKEMTNQAEHEIPKEGDDAHIKGFILNKLYLGGYFFDQEEASWKAHRCS